MTACNVTLILAYFWHTVTRLAASRHYIKYIYCLYGIHVGILVFCLSWCWVNWLLEIAPRCLYVCAHMYFMCDALSWPRNASLSYSVYRIHQDWDQGKAITENEWIKILLAAFKVQMNHSLENWCFDCHAMAANHKDWTARSVCSAQNFCLIHNKTILSGLIRDQTEC